MIADSEATETELKRDERAAQLAYEGFMKDTYTAASVLISWGGLVWAWSLL